MTFIDDINIFLYDYHNNILIKENTIKILVDQIKTLSHSNYRKDIKNIKKQINILSTDLNKYIINHQQSLGNKIIDLLFELEKEKIDGNLPISYYKDILYLYNILSSKCSRNHARYVKMPKDWILLGFMSGFLEDLVVVMRTLTQTSISKTQLVTLTDLVNNYEIYYISTNSDRFPFITKLFKENIQIIRDYIVKAINSQSKSKRIGLYTDVDNNEYYYSIQGLLGNMKYDLRVVKTINSDNYPKYAVHFTKSEIAKKIWNNEKTNSINTERELPIGMICKFKRSIHALTNINFNGTYYHIISYDKDIRNRMTHGIKETNYRQKYESGLVIDVEKLIHILPLGMIQMNEIGTLLVHQDIPHSCIINIIDTENDVENFWNS